MVIGLKPTLVSDVQKHKKLSKNVLEDFNHSPVSCPLAKYGIYLDYDPELIFDLTGTGESYDNCGELKIVRKCPNAGHEAGHYYEAVPHNCGRWLCPTCYKYPAKKEAQKIVERLYKMRRSYRENGYNLGRIEHYVVSPPQDWAKEFLYNLGGYKKLRRKAYRLLRKYGLYGGVVIFHGWRQDDETGLWYLSPHFHILGCGYLIRSNEFYERTGWVYKKKGKRETLKGTAYYLLTHCAVISGEKRSYPAYTYFGCFAYNKARVVEEREPDSLICDKCGEKVVEYAVYDDGNYLEALGEIEITKIERYYRTKGPPTKDF